jgi:hypothetical protein
MQGISLVNISLALSIAWCVWHVVVGIGFESLTSGFIGKQKGPGLFPSPYTFQISPQHYLAINAWLSLSSFNQIFGRFYTNQPVCTTDMRLVGS